MAEALERQAYYEDLLELPENQVGGNLGFFDLGGSGPGSWSILNEPELHLGQNILVPDLAGWRRKQMPKLPETAAVGTPDLTSAIAPAIAEHPHQAKSHCVFVLEPQASKAQMMASGTAPWRALLNR